MIGMVRQRTYAVSMSDQVARRDERPIEGEVLSPCGPMEQAVIDSIRAATLGARDRAVAVLARTYAKEIDMGGDLVPLGAGMLRVLEALQSTPRARAVSQRGGNRGESVGGDELDELAAVRARKSGAAPMDATPT